MGMAGPLFAAAIFYLGACSATEGSGDSMNGGGAGDLASAGSTLGGSAVVAGAGQQLGGGGVQTGGTSGSGGNGNGVGGSTSGTNGQGGAPDCTIGAMQALPEATPARNPNDGLISIHESYKAKCAAAHPVIFVGDSLTWGWDFGGDPAGKAAFDANLAGAPYSAATFGIGGDTTQFLLWRLQDGEVDGCAPSTRVAVLLIGINNIFGGATPANTAAGVQANLNELRCRLPNAKILLLGLWPATNVSAQTLDQVNAALMTFADGTNVRYLDLGADLAPSGSTTSNPNYYDGIHLTAAGYGVYAEKVKPVLDDMLK